MTTPSTPTHGGVGDAPPGHPPQPDFGLAEKSTASGCEIQREGEWGGRRNKRKGGFTTLTHPHPPHLTHPCSRVATRSSSPRWGRGQEMQGVVEMSARENTTSLFSYSHSSSLPSCPLSLNYDLEGGFLRRDERLGILKRTRLEFLQNGPPNL